MSEKIYCELKEKCEINHCGVSHSCSGMIEYDESTKKYYANTVHGVTNKVSKGIVHCTVMENLTFQRRQTELLEKIANKMEIKE